MKPRVKTLITAAMLTVLLMSGCYVQPDYSYLANAEPPKPKLECSTDRYTKDQVCFMYAQSANHMAIKARNDDRELMYLIFNQLISEGDTLYFIQVKYHNDDWIFIESGQSLTFMMNDSVQIFLESESGSSDARDIVTYGIKETAYYLVELHQILLMGEAKKLEMRLKGANGYCDSKYFDRYTIDSFAAFYDQIKAKS